MSFKPIWLVILCLVVMICFLLAGRFLVVNQPPIESDTIIVLGGGGPERELEAIKLYKEHYAPYIIVSDGGSRGNPSTEEGKKEIKILLNDGVPETAIIPEFQALSTYGNAVFTEKIMETYKFRSAIVVSSSYHMRRSQYIFNKVYAGSGISLTFCAAPVTDFSPDYWWTNSTSREYLVSEYQKLVGYVAYYGLVKEWEKYIPGLNNFTQKVLELLKIKS